MTIVIRKGMQLETAGELPQVGMRAPDFTLTQSDLSDLTLGGLKGKTVILNIFPSIDTPTCATSVREFNIKAAERDDVLVVCVSADLPFALNRFCGAEGIDNVITASTFRSSFGQDYQVVFTTGPLTGLMSRAIVVIDPEGKVIHTEQVQDISQQPDYDRALSVL